MRHELTVPFDAPLEVRSGGASSVRIVVGSALEGADLAGMEDEDVAVAVLTSLDGLAWVD